MAIDRREPHICHLIELFQLLHDVRANISRGNLFFGPFLQRALHAIGNRLESRDADRPFLAGLEQAGHELLPLEPFARPVLLHDHVRDFVNPLVAGEALRAVEAFTPSTNDFPFFALPRIDNLVAEVTTVWTLHATSPGAVIANCRIRVRSMPAWAAK